jgi:hypothetical protein
MDLSGHGAFGQRLERPQQGHRAPPFTREEARAGIGPALLATAWAALASARVESVDIHLGEGRIVKGVRGVRLAGRLAEAETAPGVWTHAFDVEAVVLVELVPRGGRR